ncbi:tetratricopeptide repeat protein [candidate division WOR-3 bacterium]|nr:tetratricopeptide repeat protein [candidate division WOR-3 bacterium]
MHMIFGFSGGAVGILLFSVITSAADLQTDSLHTIADSLRVAGDSLLELERYSEAREAFGQEIEARIRVADTSGWCRALNDKSEAHWKDGDTEQGLSLAQEALDKALAAFGEQDTLVADAYTNFGGIYKTLGSYPKALEALTKAHEIRLAVYGPDHPEVASSFSNIGIIQRNMANFEEALKNHETALDIRLKVLGEDHLDVAFNYQDIGIIYYELGEFNRTLEYFRKALEVLKKALGPEHPKVAGTYGNIAVIYSRLGEYEKALEYYERAMAIHIKAHGPEHPVIASTYNNLGNVYTDLGLYDEALENYRKAYEIRVKVWGLEHPEIATDYNNLGILYQDLGDYKRSLALLDSALVIRLKALGPDHPDVALNYQNIATSHMLRGDYQAAFSDYERALEIYVKNFGEDHPDVALVLGNLGTLYNDLGSYRKALEAFERSLEISLMVWGEDHLRIGVIHSNLGNVYDNLDDDQKALDSYEIARQIFADILGEDHPFTAACNLSIGNIYNKQGSHRKALRYYKEAVKTMEQAYGAPHPDVASAYNNMGKTYLDLGKYQKALVSYRHSLNIITQILNRNHPDIARTYFDIGSVYRIQGDKDLALFYFKRSIETFEQSRSVIESEELRGSYTETVTDRYEEIISLLLEMGKPQEAFEYLERSKSKQLKDAIEESYDVELGHGEIKEKLNESKELANKVEAVESQLLDEKLKPEDERSKSRLDNLSELLAETKAEYFRVVAEVQADPDYTFAVTVDPIQMGGVKNELPDDHKLLMSYAGSDKLYLFLVSQEGYQVRSVPVTRDSLENLVTSCRELCFDNITRLHRKGKLLDWTWADDGSEFYSEEVEPFLDLLTQLYSYLIQPVEDELKNAKLVTFIPSGKLYYVPWGALLAPATINDDELVFLSERYNWNVLTSAELLRCIQRREDISVKSEQHSAVLVGNPLGANLPFAETEVSAIQEAYPNSTTLTGASATEQELTKVTPDSRTLHLATHCILDTDSPWDSYIHLARTEETDGRWTAAEISGQSWENMELVTLSACETAIGGLRPGLEFESMAKAFSLAMEGPPSIIATLWPVSDESTKELMVTFYEELKLNPKSEALRKAQQKLIRSGKYSHPFFWAPFILIGEWR